MNSAAYPSPADENRHVLKCTPRIYARTGFWLMLSSLTIGSSRSNLLRTRGQKSLLGAHRMNWLDEFKVLGPSTKTAVDGAVLVILAGNIGDPSLFVRGSSKSIQLFRDSGYTVYLLDVDEFNDYLEFLDGCLPRRKLGYLVKEALLEIPNLVRVQIYAHARYDINLTDPGAELTAIPLSDREPHIYDSHRVYIGDLKIGKPGAAVGLIDLFTCMTVPGVQWPQLLADSTGWLVRTVMPGHSIYFPGTSFPRSRIPSTGILTGYDRNGWLLWLPGVKGVLQTTEPNAAEIVGPNSLLRTAQIRRWLARTLEPFREFRRQLRRRRSLTRRSTQK